MAQNAAGVVDNIVAAFKDTEKAFPLADDQNRLICSYCHLQERSAGGSQFKTRFESPKQFGKHVLGAHGKIKHQCTKCNNRFPDAGSLTQHNSQIRPCSL